MIIPASFLCRAAPLVCALGLFVCFSALSVAELAEGMSQTNWVSSTNSKARLVSGTVDVGGKPTRLAGVQIGMDPGWKTYWQNPGDSGVPPSFDWSGSKNLKSAEVLFPAPHRFADGGGTAIGYKQEVVFPVVITPEREDEPVELKLTFDFGLCKDLCIPNEVSLSLALPADGGQSSGESLLLARALNRVPKPAEPDALPRVLGIDAQLDGPEPSLRVDVLFHPEATGTDLFIAAGDAFVPVPKPLGPPDGGKQNFEILFGSAREAESIKGKPLTLTLVSDAGSTKTVWTAE
jgi:DsbC/DsbD-like thiol-disulfide interchange protein